MCNVAMLWLSLVIVFIARTVSSKETCHVRIQTYNAQSVDRTGFFEVNGNYMMTWEDQADTSVVDSLQLLVLDTKCNRIDQGSYDMQSNGRTNVDNIAGYLARAPLGGFLLGATTAELLESDDSSFMIPFFKTLGIDLSVSQGEVDSDIGGMTDPLTMLMFIVQRGKPDNSKWKSLAPKLAPRVLDATYDVTGACMAPLPPGHIFQEEVFGVRNTDDMSGIHSGLDTERDAHIDTSNVIACDGHIVGWEYIPYTGGRFYAGAFRKSSNTYTLLGVSTVTTGPLSYSVDDVEPRYKCLMNYDHIAVRAGDMYGFFYDDYTDNEPPIVRRSYAYESQGSRPYNDPYPCTEVTTWYRAAKVATLNADESDADPTPSPFFTGSSTDLLMDIALRPIMDYDFRYKCMCGSTPDCWGAGDRHMVCKNGMCECMNLYVYNRHHNKCLYREPLNSDDSGFTSELSSTIDEGNVADHAQDDDGPYASPWLLGSDRTCAQTDWETQPHYVITTENPINLYSIAIRTPEPIDPKMLLYSDENDDDAHWDEIIWDSTAINITVEKIRIFGPWPWAIHSLEDCDLSSDFTVINRDFTATPQEFYYDSDFGTVGAAPGSICRLEYVGILTMDEGGCLETRSSSEVDVITYDYDDCTYFYISEANDANEYYISQLQSPYEDERLKFDSLSQGEELQLGASSTTFQFYDGGSGSLGTLADLDPNGSGAYIKPTQISGNLFLYWRGNKIILSSSNTRFYMRKAIRDDYPSWHYNRVSTYDEGYSGDSLTFPGFSFSGTDVCAEIADPGTHATFAQLSATIMYTDSDRVSVVGGKSDSYPKDTPSSQDDIVVRVTDPGVRNFRVGVSNRHFSEESIDRWNITECHAERGSVPPGQKVIYNCDKPIHGKSVVIYLEKTGASRFMHLCDVDLYYPLGPRHGDACYNDNDCISPHAHMLVCNTNNVTLSICDCMDGYQFNPATDMCEDVNECLDEGMDEGMAEMCYNSNSYMVDGLVNGRCINTEGSYECECPDGYFWDEMGHGCRDIDESNKLNCGCEHMCENLQVDGDNEPYECSCYHGYRLAENKHSCLDINECEEGHCMHPCPVDSDCTLAESCRNMPGSYECVCPGGYRHTIGGHCIDIDECTEPPTSEHFAGCEGGCTNHMPHMSHTRYECDCRGIRGYQLNPADQHSCIDIDECMMEPNNCSHHNGGTPRHKQATCLNTPGSYQCHCHEGYKWNHTHHICQDVNECEFGWCQHQCVNTMGSYRCKCREGYHSSGIHGRYCVDIDECEHELCGQGIMTIPGTVYGKCKNLHGSFECLCPEGYEWRERDHICKDRNECEVVRPCEDVCHNKFMLEDHVPYECECSRPGLTLGNDLRSCVDIDECEEDNLCSWRTMMPIAPGEMTPGKRPSRRVKGTCHNTYGSYTCQCPVGYTWHKHIGCSVLSDCTLTGDCDEVRFTMCLDMDWDPTLTDLHHRPAQKLARGIEESLAELYSHVDELDKQGVIDSKVLRFFECSVGVEVGLTLISHLPEEMKSAIVRRLSDVISRHESMLMINSVKYHVSSLPVRDGNHPWPTAHPKPPPKPISVCDYHGNKYMCEHGGYCIDKMGQPECVCTGEYYGDRCEKKRFDAVELPPLNITEIGLVAGGVIVGLLVVIIISCICVLWCRRNNQQDRAAEIPLARTAPPMGKPAHVPQPYPTSNYYPGIY